MGFNMRFSFMKSVSLAIVLAVGAAACGAPTDEQPAATEIAQSDLTYTPAVDWAMLTDGADAKVRDGVWVVTASNTTPGYQVGRRINVAGFDTISLRFDIATSGGPGYIGVLAGDGSRWLGNFYLAADSQSANTVSVPVSGDEVQIVIQTDRQAANNSTFTLNNVEYALY
jgi:hypothetical protein